MKTLWRRFVLWIARDEIAYLGQCADSALAAQGAKHAIEINQRKLEVDRLSKLTGRYAEALAIICRLKANMPASEIAYRAFRPDGDVFSHGFLRPEKQSLESFLQAELGQFYRDPVTRAAAAQTAARPSDSSAKPREP